MLGSTVPMVALLLQILPAATAAVYEFDAISLKPDQSCRTSGPGEFSAALVEAAKLRGGPGTADPERVTATCISLQGLLTAAYEVQSQQVSGPGWIADSKYVLEAKVPPGATREQADLMLRQALAERFKLALHREQKELQVWELVIAKDTPKLQAAADQNAQPQMKVQAKDGIRHDTYTAFRISKTDPDDPGLSLDKILSSYLAATGMVASGVAPDIVDKTGLTGRYDFSLEYETSLAPDTGGLTLVTALEKQVGLKLEQKKAALDVLVVDHAEKVPSEN